MFRTGLIALLAATALSSALPSAVFAADAVSVHSGEHDGYTRVVFQWPSDVPYHVVQEAPGKLKVTFDRSASLDSHGLETGGASNVTSMRQLSAGGAPLALELAIPQASKFRDFDAGGRIIVDIYDPPGKKAAAAKPPEKTIEKPIEKPALVKTHPPVPKKAEAVKSAPKPVAAPKPPDSKPEAAKPETPKPITPQPVVPKPVAPKPEPARAAAPPLAQMPAMPAAVSAAPAPAPAALAPPGAAPDIITLTTTSSIGLAAFTRDGWLWLVTDRADLAIPPQLAGPDAARLGRLEHVDVPGAAAWRLKLPGDFMPGLHVYGEGGGLIWKIALTPQARERHETAVERPKEADGKAGTLVWPLQGVTRIVDLPDADEGDTLKVATVASADQYAGAPYQYVDLETLPSAIGVAILPHAADLAVKKTDKGVEAGRPNGLTLSGDRDITRRTMQLEGQKTPLAQSSSSTVPPPLPPRPGTESATAAAAQPAAPAMPIERFFDFEHWSLGGTDALASNQTLLLSGLKAKDTNGRVQDLLTLAKMNLANDRGPEALGFLSFAAEELPSIADSPEFVAMRGAAEAIGGKYELALKDLNMPALNPYKELDYWRAYTLAWLEDWKQAAGVMPGDMSVLLRYPQPLLEKMVPKMAEIALRGGDIAKAQLLLGALREDKETLHPWTLAALDYLQGQANRQQNKPDEAEKLWAPLVTGKDNFFRVRAGLALTMLELEKNKIKPQQAIDRLEGLRYGWRGDELEAQINYMLGKLYLGQKQYMKGFTILRDAAVMSPDADIAKDITNYMAASFKDFLMNDKTISPVDAMNIYQQFHELAPPGDEGNKLVQNLAERLASTDLLGRAGDLLQNQVDYSLQGREKADVAMRLAAIGLLNKDPQRTAGALDKADAFYQTLPAGGERDRLLRNVSLMRARAVSQQGKTEEALGMLAKMGPSQDVSRLRADIAWQAGMWPDAADALQDLIADENMQPGQKLNEYEANLILNRAVALNLGGDRVELATMRQKYADMMKPTARGNLFEVVTRPHSINVMTEQQTLQGLVGEVDLFRDFLNDYKSVTDKGQLNTTAGPAAK